MLGYVVPEQRATADALIRAVVAPLRAQGVAVAGAMQVNPDGTPDGDIPPDPQQGTEARRSHMDLHLLPGAEVVRISQDLGGGAQGCRLDPDGLERAAGLTAVALDRGADLLIINKFGKQEADGRGFRPLIGEALLRDIPVLVSVAPGQLPAFQDFVGPLGQRLPARIESILDWCQSALGQSAA